VKMTQSRRRGSFRLGALQQVVGYLEYTGRDANIVAEAALDPKLPHGALKEKPMLAANKSVSQVEIARLSDPFRAADLQYRGVRTVEMLPADAIGNVERHQ